MLSVNLIAARRTRQIRLQQTGEALVRVSVVLGLFILAVVIFGWVHVRRGEEEIAQTNLAKIAYQDQANEVRRLRAAIADLTPRVSEVKTADRRLDHWRYLYAQIAQSLPDDAVLDTINYSKSANGGQLNVDGKADDAYTVAKILLSLNEQPGFSDVQMGTSTFINPHQASMSVRLPIKPLPEDAPPPPPAPAAAPGGK